MALNSSGQISLGGSTAGQSVALELGLGTTTQISLNDTAVRDLAEAASGQISMPSDFWGKSAVESIQNGAWVSGSNFVRLQVYNTMNSSGSMSSDNSWSGTGRQYSYGGVYGVDKGITGFGRTGSSGTDINTVSTVSNTGSVSGDISTSGTARHGISYSTYGTSRDRGVFVSGVYSSGSGTSGFVYTKITNHISNTGSVSSNSSYSGSASYDGGGCGYGNDKGIFGFGRYANGTYSNIVHTITNTGSISGDISTSATGRILPEITNFNKTQEALVRGGWVAPVYTQLTIHNIISNTGSVGSNQSNTAGTNSSGARGSEYGGDKGVLAFGYLLYSPNFTNNIQYVSNTGSIAGDTAGTGTGRVRGASTGFGV